MALKIILFVLALGAAIALVSGQNFPIPCTSQTYKDTCISECGGCVWCTPSNTSSTGTCVDSQHNISSACPAGWVAQDSPCSGATLFILIVVFCIAGGAGIIGMLAAGLLCGASLIEKLRERASFRTAGDDINNSNDNAMGARQSMTEEATPLRWNLNSSYSMAYV